MFNKWVVDVTYEIPCFVPYEEGELILGMNLITEKCPGQLVGVIHAAGQDAVEKYCAENPNWYETFSK
jgi:hypothetical protein